jgi:hypothetical protein|tara:strand:- start:1692 stop:1925 length:234 start_codon:yes stop_codon:yes gene_type:complete
MIIIVFNWLGSPFVIGEHKDTFETYWQCEAHAAEWLVEYRAGLLHIPPPMRPLATAACRPVPGARPIRRQVLTRGDR